MEQDSNLDNKKRIIHDCARKLFAEKGFKETNVADIMREAAAAVGTFYSYYPSKDRLFLEIYEEESVVLGKRTMAQIDPSLPPAQAILAVMRANLDGIASNPILREWYNPDVMGRLEKHARETGGGMDFMYRGFLDRVRVWQNEGRLRGDISAEMVMAVFASIIRIGYHKEEIGLQYFPKVQELLTEFVLAGITGEERL